MQASLETLGTLERRLKIAVPIDQINAEVASRLKRLQRTAKLHGFRPGKVPLKVVEQQYGSQVRQDVLGDTVERSFGDAVRENNLRVAGYPRIESQPAPAEASAFEYIATFEVFPEIAIGDLSASTIERPVVSIGDADIDRTVDILRKQRTQYEPVERAAGQGDVVIIDYTGRIDGIAFEGGSATGQAVTLGEGRLLADFEAQVTGMNKGETRMFDMVFPEDYHGKEVAGKSATFEVTVRDVREARVPPLDAELARSLGIEDGDLGKMREDIRQNLEREVKRRVEKQVKDQALKALLDSATMEVPKALIDMEIERLIAGTTESLKARGMQQGAADMPREVFEPEAKRRVSIGLVLAEVVRLEKIEAQPEQVKAVIEDYAQSYERPEDVVRWYYQSPERVREIEAVVVENNVVSWLLSKAAVTDKPVAFEDIMGNG
jgi:trigger factor